MAPVQASTVAYSPAFSPAHPQQPPPPQHGNPQHAFSSQLDMAQAQVPPRGGTFDTTGVASALPQHRSGPYSQGQPRYDAIAMPSPVSQFAAQSAMAQGQQYYMPQHAHMAHFYQPPLSPQAQAQAQTHVPLRPDLGYYSNSIIVNQQTHPATQFYYPQPGHFPGQAGHVPAVLGQYAATGPPHLDQRQSQPQSGGQIDSSTSPASHRKGANEIRQSIVRGPPRKPRQSGHAIWIGNLPPQADLMSLVHHVCKEAEGLESLFLISKSNCAFANFKDEQASVAAQRKLHDSKFLTVRLVSRLRKSTVEGPAGVTAPTGPAASTPHVEPGMEPATLDSRAVEKSTTASATVAGTEEPPLAGAITEGGTPSKDRFFILKSLTVEDIELSVRTGIWATQSHNEETLNSAFKDADNVYLVFSANKSGEYFGYARMTSPVNENPEAAIEFAPKAQATTDVELPKAIPTESTEFAPKGRIIDDSARGTIFWEAERDESSGGDGEGSGGGSVNGDTGSVKSGQEGPGETKAWGKPFRLEWLSTARLPFYRTRGLRNPWNANREVKIARDGTELEPSVGRRLIGLFNRAQSPALGMAPSLVPSAVPAAARGVVPVAGYSAPTRQVFPAQ
ncbi:hypothetical protein OQA88_11702 [Cercophora sp. LCS_1]